MGGMCRLRILCIFKGFHHCRSVNPTSKMHEYHVDHLASGGIEECLHNRKQHVSHERITYSVQGLFLNLLADDTNILSKDAMWTNCVINWFGAKEWLDCYKLPQNIPKNYYIIFTPRSKVVGSMRIQKNSRVYITQFLGVQIDSQLSWKMHSNYICKMLSKCVAILLKIRKVLGIFFSQPFVTHLHIHKSFIVTISGAIFNINVLLFRKNGYLSS